MRSIWAAGAFSLMCHSSVLAAEPVEPSVDVSASSDVRRGFIQDDSWQWFSHPVGYEMRTMVAHAQVGTAQDGGIGRAEASYGLLRSSAAAGGPTGSPLTGDTEVESGAQSWIFSRAESDTLAPGTVVPATLTLSLTGRMEFLNPGGQQFQFWHAHLFADVYAYLYQGDLWTTLFEGGADLSSEGAEGWGDLESVPQVTGDATHWVATLQLTRSIDFELVVGDDFVLEWNMSTDARLREPMNVWATSDFYDAGALTFSLTTADPAVRLVAVPVPEPTALGLLLPLSLALIGRRHRRAQ